jgi:uracil-DNA glycosylase family 4
MKLSSLQQEIESCTKCPRLLEHCRSVAITKRRAWSDWDYWGKPVPSFGDPDARLLIVGLAPGAHGANRTGRMFTGDRSSEFLYRSLYRAGFASQPGSQSLGDGLTLHNAWITAAAHCAPPDNKPSVAELRNCRPYLEREFEIFGRARVIVALGKIAFDACLATLKHGGKIAKTSGFRFGHGVLHELEPALLCSYHPSQQNTSTGRLTQEMLDEVFLLAARIAQVAPARRPAAGPGNQVPKP